MNNFSFKKYTITLLLALLSVAAVYGQGWEKYFGGVNQQLNYEDWAESVITLRDRGYAVAGWSESFSNDNDRDAYVIRLDVDGDLVWERVYDEGLAGQAIEIIEARDSNLLLVGWTVLNGNSSQDASLIKIDQNGQLLWSKQFGGSGTEIARDIIPSSDGGYLIVGQTEDITTEIFDIFLWKVDEDGNEEWSTTYGNTGNDIAYAAVALPNGYAITGYTQNPNDNNDDILLLRTNLDGDLILQETYDFSNTDLVADMIGTQDGMLVLTGYKQNSGTPSDVFLLKVNPEDGAVEWYQTYGDPSFGDQATALVEAPNGDIVITGLAELSISDINVFLARTDADGNEIWKTQIGRENTGDFGYGIDTTYEGGFIIAGFNSADLILGNDVTVVKTNGEGDIYSNYLEGNVFFDESGNCAKDADEIGLEEWLVKAESDALTFFGSTDSLGNFSILLDTGVYELSVLPKNGYWEPCIASYSGIELINFYDTTQLIFPMHDAISCPQMEVNISAPYAQACGEVTYQVNYCNDGTITAIDAAIDVFFDEQLTFETASLPITSQQGNMLGFDLGDVAIGECAQFSVQFSLSCDVGNLEALTVSAVIYPDTICLPVDPDWDGADIVVEGICENNEIKFTITNNGDDMDNPQEFVITEDIVMFSIGPYNIGGGEDTTIVITPIDNQTYRLIAEQAPGHPGNSFPTVAIEGCLADGTTEFQTGAVSYFPEDDADLFIDIDVQEYTETPQNITGHPNGYPSVTGDSLLIAANTDITYRFNFQNTGLDTVRRLVIRDTLPATLDVSSIQSGVSSHPYTFEIYDGGIVKLLFENLELPHSGADESASHGFVNFRISQLPNLPAGTQISNSATIYMAYDRPFVTDTVTHYIGGANLKDFVNINLVDTSIETYIPNVRLNTFPNPFVDGLTIELEGIHYSNLQLEIYNISGQRLHQQAFQGNQVHLTRGNLPSGTLVFQIRATTGQVISSGKVVVQ